MVTASWYTCSIIHLWKETTINGEHYTIFLHLKKRHSQKKSTFLSRQCKGAYQHRLFGQIQWIGLRILFSSVIGYGFSPHRLLFVDKLNEMVRLKDIWLCRWNHGESHRLFWGTKLILLFGKDTKISETSHGPINRLIQTSHKITKLIWNCPQFQVIGGDSPQSNLNSIFHRGSRGSFRFKLIVHFFKLKMDLSTSFWNRIHSYISVYWKNSCTLVSDTNW